MNIREQSEKLERKYLSPYASLSCESQGRDREEEQCDIRTVYQRDRDRIIHCKAFRRMKHKTQVFLAPMGDHYRTRLTHTLEVAQIARTIAKALRLNEDLTEAIALGHDLGHTPFGHAGERFLSELLQNETGRFFNHNVQSVRVLENMFARNVSLQTLDGILCHNGEFEQQKYRPHFGKTFAEYDREVEDSYVIGHDAISRLVPLTLEACVVRICDIVAYLGKDRQDARIAKIIDKNYQFKTNKIGAENAAIINNMTVDILENSYGKDYILLSKSVYNDLKTAKRENYEVIYNNKKLEEQYNEIIKPMFKEMYYKLLDDVHNKSTDSIIYKHHIKFINENLKYYKHKNYLDEEENQIVVDFIASMTDDYFIELHKYLFPDSKYKIEYKSYFQ